jgi:hypothetical protein
MDWGVLIIVGVVWLVAAIAVSLVIGRVIRRRDR